MKKINSNGYAGKIISVAVLFLAVIPGCCRIVFLVFHMGLFMTLMFSSLAIGLIVLAFFVSLLIVEFYQDKKAERAYRIIKKTKTPLSNGFYECQSCGNRLIRVKDKSCGVCGASFTAMEVNNLHGR